MMFHAPLRPRPAQPPRERVATVMQSLRRLMPLVWRFAPGLLIASGVLNLIPVSIQAYQVYLTRALVEEAKLVVEGDHARLAAALMLVGLQAAISGGRSLASMIQRQVALKLQLKSSFEMDRMVTTKAGRLPLAFFDRSESFDLLQRAQSGLAQRGLSVVDTTLSIAQQVLSVASYVVILAHFHWALAGVLLLFVLPTLFTHLRAGELRFRQMRAQTPTHRKAGYLSTLLRGREAAKEVRVFGLQEHLAGRWEVELSKANAERIQLERKTSWSRLAADIGSAIAIALATAFLLWLGAQGRITLGDYVALGAALATAHSSMQGVAFQLAVIYENALFVTDLFEFLDLPEESRSTRSRPFPGPLRRGIDVEGLTFAYPGSKKEVLQSISFRIRPGEKVAIVGENGSGKTTLVKCLLGLYLPTGGTIRYDGIATDQIDTTSLRASVTAVFQDFVRYQVTVGENVGFGQVEATGDTERLHRAAALGGADEVAATLAEGFDATVGAMFNGGRDLSVGQWQKLALSRAFFREAEVIALDEPTASMDPRAEAAVFERFARLAEGKTALLISHRLGTCRSADRILVLKDGCLVEEGTHEALMEMGGEYARMFETQARWYA